MFKIELVFLLNKLLLIFLGFVIGVLSGFFGVGGAFILTPALNILGIPMITAVGTGLVFTLAVSLVGGTKHFLAGNVFFKVVLYVGFISIAGVMISEPIVRYLDTQNTADTIIRIVYIVLLITLGVSTYKKGNNEKKTHRKETMLSKLNSIPPFVQIDNKNVSFWSLAFIGIFVGFLKGFMGVGGGFILVPLFVLILDMDMHKAAGTSLATLLLSSLFGSYLYILSGNVLLTTTALLVCGTLFGLNLGVKGSKNINGNQLQKFYAVFLTMAAAGIIFKQFEMNIISLIYTLTLCSVTALVILLRYNLNYSIPFFKLSYKHPKKTDN